MGMILVDLDESYQNIPISKKYVMESRGSAYIMIEEVNSYHNICNKSGFTILMCNLFRTKVSNKSKLSNSAPALP